MTDESPDLVRCLDDLARRVAALEGAQEGGELKPCPFCGSERPPFVDIAPRAEEDFVRCLRCDVFGPRADTEAEARRLWNERA